jgi:hypothetical protein
LGKTSSFKVWTLVFKMRYYYCRPMKLIAITIFFLLLISLRAPADPDQPQLPGEVPFSNETGFGKHITVTVRLQDGKAVPMVVDTGSPVTLLDESLKSKLGPQLGISKTLDWSNKVKCSIYAAPKLYLGKVPLLTGDFVLTCNFKKIQPKHPPMGILGMDCLKHYCIQLDFAAGKMRFLSPEQMDAGGPGVAFPLIYSTVGEGQTHYFRTFIHHTGLVGGQGENLLIDTGLDIDGGVAPEILEEQEQKLNIPKKKLDKTTWYIPECVWEGQTYTNIEVKEAAGRIAGTGANVLGLRFLARHLVTFDFPDGMMYLQRQSAGPRDR